MTCWLDLDEDETDEVSLPWPQGWFMAEAEAHIEFGLKGWNGYDPKACGLIAIKWLEKALTTP